MLVPRCPSWFFPYLLPTVFPGASAVFSWIGRSRLSALPPLPTEVFSVFFFPLDVPPPLTDGPYSFTSLGPLEAIRSLAFPLSVLFFSAIFSQAFLFFRPPFSFLTLFWPFPQNGISPFFGPLFSAAASSFFQNQTLSWTFF